MGSVIEPNVIFDVGKVNFGPLLLSGKNKELVKLKNLEDVPISFAFEKESIKGESEYGDSLQVNPMSGVIKPLSDLPVEILFAPKNEQQYNYNLVCNVKRKSRPITLNVKGIGYILRHQVFIHQTLINNDQINNLDFGDIYVNESTVRVITIENQGDFNFDYSLKK